MARPLPQGHHRPHPLQRQPLPDRNSHADHPQERPPATAGRPPHPRHHPHPTQHPYQRPRRQRLHRRTSRHHRPLRHQRPTPPPWWPILLKNAAHIALKKVIVNAAEPVDKNNVPIFHRDDLGRFLPTTRKAKELNRALFLRALAKHHPLPIDPDLDQHFQYVADQQITAWITHAINRFPQQLVPDDCNYVAATGAIIRPDEQLTIHQAAVQLTDRYDNPLADQEPSHNAIRIILHDSDPTYSHVHIPDNLDQYSHRIGNLAAMLASVLARPLQHPEQHHVAIAIIGRIIRTASICSNIHLPTISTNTAIAILVTHALEDIAILAPTLPTELVAPLHRDILIATNAGRISAVHTLTPNPQSET